MWGEVKDQSNRKKNPGSNVRAEPMTYANMARGIRYSRDAGYFVDISDDEQKLYGKKLVFKFSKECRNHCRYLNSSMSP